MQLWEKVAQARRQEVHLSELERNSTVRYRVTDVCLMIYVAGCEDVDESIAMKYAQLTLVGCGR